MVCDLLDLSMHRSIFTFMHSSISFLSFFCVLMTEESFPIGNDALLDHLQVFITTIYRKEFEPLNDYGPRVFGVSQEFGKRMVEHMKGLSDVYDSPSKIAIASVSFTDDEDTDGHITKEEIEASLPGLHVIEESESGKSCDPVHCLFNTYHALLFRDKPPLELTIPDIVVPVLKALGQQALPTISSKTVGLACSSQRDLDIPFEERVFFPQDYLPIAEALQARLGVNVNKSSPRFGRLAVLVYFEEDSVTHLLHPDEEKELVDTGSVFGHDFTKAESIDLFCEKEIC